MSDAPGKPEKPAAPAPFEAPGAGTFRCPSCGAPAAEGASACVHCGSLLATRRCVACLTLNPRDADRCTHCGALLPKETLSPVPAASCPECRVLLVARTSGVIGFSECGRCGGLFLRPGTFEAVSVNADARARMKGVEPPTAPKPGGVPLKFHYRACPVCRKLMHRVNFGGFSGIVIDVCRQDGVWFDRGELSDIVAFLEKGGYEKVKQSERDRLREEVRALEARKAAGGSLPVTFDGSEPSWGRGLLSLLVEILPNIFLSL